MVSKGVGSSGGAFCLTLAPNHSLSLRAQEWVTLFLVVVFMMMSVVFVASGAWVVLPFVGLEVAALLLVTQMVRRYCNQRERVFFEGDGIRVEKQCGQRSSCWGFKLSGCSLMLVHDEACLLHHVTLVGEAGLVELGDFLSEADLEDVITCLEGQGIKRRHDASWVMRGF